DRTEAGPGLHPPRGARAAPRPGGGRRRSGPHGVAARAGAHRAGAGGERGGGRSPRHRPAGHRAIRLRVPGLQPAGRRRPHLSAGGAGGRDRCSSGDPDRAAGRAHRGPAQRVRRRRLHPQGGAHARPARREPAASAPV
ncbi:MAG: hypothetical protein AVDCRST_MAG68-2606, partial [uncultured Gemmatimonadetes bacterium]